MRPYVLTLAALLALTGLTFGLSFAELGSWGVPVALTIGAAKAALVVLFFMHLTEQGAPARMVVALSTLVATLLIVLATLDVQTRRHHEPVDPGARSGQATEP